MPGGIDPTLAIILTWPVPSAHPVTRSWLFPVIILVVYAIAVAVFSARLWSRLVLRGNRGLDDLFITIAMVPTTMMVISIVGGLRAWGFDKHVYDLSIPEAITSRKLTLSIEFLYVIATGCTKISILFFYRRFANNTLSTGFKWAVRLSIAAVVLSTFAFTVALVLSCQPLNAWWKQVDLVWAQTHIRGRDYKCFDESADLLASAAVSIIQDILACFLPSILFWKLSLPTRQKVALGSLFFVGLM
jgi:hypothetical protein